MQKKPGQISSNTLSLRFMQNAARAREEREMEVKAKRVRTEEEWELVPSEAREEGWGTGEGIVSYERSYIPFLFPGRASSSGHTPPATHGTSAANAQEDEGESALSVTYKGRRKFGKHGLEEAEEKQAPVLPLPDGLLPRGARSISSHGRAAAASSSKSTHRPPLPPPPPPQHTPTPPHSNLTHTPAQATPQHFIKPPIDAPRARNDDDTGARNRRPGGERGSGASSHGHTNSNPPDGVERGERGMKRKRME